ncbi:hypothetical protein CXG81DRAFT_13549, partial [Caulochytrium protostelioides]
DSLVPAPDDFINPVPPVTPLTSKQFLAIIDEVRAAIAEGIHPVRIAQGSSGSYFCKNRLGEVVGVFKPKDEEPYGQLNPKWTKWVHKNLFPCCFGRSCLIPNLGYISEAAASYLDRRLELNVVPRTEIVYLSSTSFYYNAKDTKAYRLHGVPLPEKIGSFQIFLKGFRDATTFFKQGYRHIFDAVPRYGDRSTTSYSHTPTQPSSSSSGGPPLPAWSPQMQREFQWGFERLVVLDYLQRNTDRGLDNWMPGPTDARRGAAASRSHVQIAAIDNGLAFPYKHPDRWRSYPYGWAFLPIARVPFSEETRRQILHLLTSPTWWKETYDGMEALFRLDSDFNETMFRKQKAVLRGEGYNLVEVLQRSRSGDPLTGSPLALVRRPVVAVYEEVLDEDGGDEYDDDVLLTGAPHGRGTRRKRSRRRGRPRGFVARSKRGFHRVRQRFETFTKSQPFFHFC